MTMDASFSLQSQRFYKVPMSSNRVPTSKPMIRFEESPEVAAMGGSPRKYDQMSSGPACSQETKRLRFHQRLDSTITAPSSHQSLPSLGSSPSLRDSSNSLRAMLRRQTHPRTSPTIPSCTHNATFRSTHRRSSMGTAKIVQRSDSRSVKQMLKELQDLCSAPNSPPPRSQLETLLTLVPDAYYRVVVCKYQGVDILSRVGHVFPELHSLVQRLLLILQENHSSVPVAPVVRREF